MKRLSVLCLWPLFIFDKPCVLSASHFQATTATINTSHFSPQLEAQVWSQAEPEPAHFLLGLERGGRAQTNRNSNIHGSSPWALHLHSVTLDLTAPGLAGQVLCLRAWCCWNLPTSKQKYPPLRNTPTKMICRLPMQGFCWYLNIYFKGKLK